MLCKTIHNAASCKYIATINGLLLHVSCTCNDQIQLALLFLATRWGCSRVKYVNSVL